MLLYAKKLMYLQSVNTVIHFIVTFYIISLTQLKSEDFLTLIELWFEGNNCNCLMNTLSKLQNSQLLQSFLEIFNSSHFAGKRIWRIHPWNFHTYGRGNLMSFHSKCPSLLNSIMAGDLNLIVNVTVYIHLFIFIARFSQIAV